MEADHQIPPAYSPGSFCGTSSQRNSCDSDFSDVFGGPPRRFSMPEVRLRYSFGEMDDEEERVAARLLAEKPVFGQENVVRRRRQRGDDFFDDIFKGTGDQSSGSPTSNNRDRDNPSAPGSRIMSPARPLLTKTESSSAQFSLPSKLNKAMEFPNSQYQLDNSTDGYSSPRSSSTVSLSRFSNQAIAGQDEIKTQVPKDINIIQRNSRKDRKSSVVSNDNYFHFSIYKWAAKGAPMIMPLLSRNKDISTFDRSASSNGRIESELPTEDQKVECERKEHSRSKQERQGIQYSIEKAAFDIFESISCHNNARDAIVSGEAKQNKPEKYSKSERKLLREFLNEMDEQPEIKGNKTTAPNSDAPKNAKKNEGATTESNGGNAYKSSLQCADVDPLVTPVKDGVDEEIEDFVQVFNKEIYSRPKEFVQRRSESCRWTATGVDQRENEVNENLTKDEAQKCTDTKNPYSSESPHWDSKFSVENLDDLFEDEFQVQELSDDLEIVVDTAEDSVDIKALDAQIRQWSVGKEGNIRSLLSTLQYVIWAGSGWKPIPLVDLIEANSVKKAYQKALLRLHPDKLQQKNAPSHQKYIAEKVFDLLKEAWDHFNNLAPL